MAHPQDYQYCSRYKASAVVVYAILHRHTAPRRKQNWLIGSELGMVWVRMGQSSDSTATRRRRETQRRIERQGGQRRGRDGEREAREVDRDEQASIFQTCKESSYVEYIAAGRAESQPDSDLLCACLCLAAPRLSASAHPHSLFTTHCTHSHLASSQKRIPSYLSSSLHIHTLTQTPRINT